MRKVLRIIIVLLLLSAVVVGAVFLAKKISGSVGEPKKGAFYVVIDGEKISESAGGYSLSKDAPLEFSVYVPDARAIKIAVSTNPGVEFLLVADGYVKVFSQLDFSDYLYVEQTENGFRLCQRTCGFNEMLIDMFNTYSFDLSFMPKDVDLFSLNIRYGDEVICIGFSPSAVPAVLLSTPAIIF